MFRWKKIFLKHDERVLGFTSHFYDGMYLSRHQSSIFTSSASRDSALVPGAENLWLILIFSLGSVIQNN